MNIEYFYYFIETANEKSLSKAARNYHISQQGMSRAIKQLEIEYGTELLHRNVNTISLTEAGRVFLKEAEHLVACHNRLRDSMVLFCEDDRNTPTEALQVYATLNVALNVWPHIAKLLEEKEGLRPTSLKELPPERIARKMSTLSSSDVISIVSISSLYKSLFEIPALKFDFLLDIELMAKVGKNSKFAQRGIVTISDIMHSRLALHDDRGLNAMLERMLSDSGDFKKNICMQTSNLQMIDDEILNHDAIGFSNSFVKSFSSSGSEFRIIPLEKTFRTPIYVVTNSALQPSEGAQNLINSIIEVVEENYGRPCLEKASLEVFSSNIVQQKF